MTTGPAAQPPHTLASVAWDWGDAYRIGYAWDRWAAWRRDTHRLLAADTLAGLDQAMVKDHAACPVHRDSDPPGATAYLSFPDGYGVTDEDVNFIVAGLFPVPNALIPDPVTITCTGCGQWFVSDATSPAARDSTCIWCDLGLPRGEDLPEN